MQHGTMPLRKMKMTLHSIVIAAE